MSPKKVHRSPAVTKALKALEDSKVPHEDGCTCSGCKGVRTIDEIVYPKGT